MPEKNPIINIIPKGPAKFRPTDEEKKTFEKEKVLFEEKKEEIWKIDGTKYYLKTETGENIGSIGLWKDDPVLEDSVKIKTVDVAIEYRGSEAVDILYSKALDIARSLNKNLALDCVASKPALMSFKRFAEKQNLEITIGEEKFFDEFMQTHNATPGAFTAKIIINNVDSFKGLQSSQEIEQKVLNNLINFFDLPKESTSKDIYLKFFEEDQKIMNSKGVTDYLDPLNEVNKIKNLLTEYEANVHPGKMNKDIKDILGLYYHHASQFEYQKNNKETAIEYIDKALKFKDPNINQITGLLSLLLRGQITEAEEYITKMTSSEVGTAKSLLTHFKENYV